MVAALAVAATTCSLATARAAIHATKAEVPSPASPQEPPLRADPALADRVACFDGVLAVQLEVVQPVYRRRDPNCCPTGGFDRVLYRFDGRSLVVTRRWHTRTFVAP